MTTLDYRALLKRYVELVRVEQGVDFIPGNTGLFAGFFTEEERSALWEISDELDEAEPRWVPTTVSDAAPAPGLTDAGCGVDNAEVRSA